MRRPGLQPRVGRGVQSRPAYERPACRTSPESPRRHDRRQPASGYWPVWDEDGGTGPLRVGSSQRGWRGREKNWRGASTSSFQVMRQQRSTYYESARPLAVAAGGAEAESVSLGTTCFSSAEGGGRRSNGSGRELRGTAGEGRTPSVRRPFNDARATPRGPGVLGGHGGGEYAWSSPLGGRSEC